MKTPFLNFSTNSRTCWRRLGVRAGQLATAGLLAAVCAAGPASAQTPTVRQMETLGRGVVAVDQGDGKVFISWRLLPTDAPKGGFDLYRKPASGAAIKLNATPLTGGTNFVDERPDPTPGTTYYVTAAGAVAGAAPEAAPVWAQQYMRLPLQRPAAGVTPAGGTYTYSPNDCSAADLDGDGTYEIIVKWDPSNSQDNSLSGYTGNVYLDAYKLDGTRMWRIDLGRNIRAGAHYTQFLVYDFDGDGKAELACKTADGTMDGTGQVLGDANADYRQANGYILRGPEYLTMFNGLTGAAYPSVTYLPRRHPDPAIGDNPTPAQMNAVWGDNYGNRIDRFLAGVAYLDGVHPSLVMCRGYYTRTVLVAWDFRNGQLTQRWTFDSNDGNPANLAYRGQGNHQLTVADVDADGKDEIVYGSCAIDDNGTGMYSTGRGHGDAMHVSDFDPRRPGLEVFSVHETQSQYGSAPLDFRDARTGQLIWGAPGPNQGDIGRGVTMDIDPRTLGSESWASRGGLYAVDGTQISTSRPSPINFAVWWDGDLLRELLDNTTISKWNWQTSRISPLLAAGALGVASNNTTKATPNLSADLFGDWREEVIWRDANNEELLIFTTTIPTQYRLPTLMSDPQYRLSIAWQNVSYNQPPHTGYYLGDGMDLTAYLTPQTLNFGALPDKLLGDLPFAPAATASSGLPVDFVSSDTTVAVVRNGQVQIRRAGTVTITAIQAGDATYASAPPVSQTLTVVPLRVQVLYKDSDDQRPQNQDIKPSLQLANQGPVAVAYAELTARYWLTPENFSGLATSIDYAALGTSAVHARYVPLAQPRAGALGYVEYSFDAGTGSLAVGGNSGEIRSRFHNSAYGELNEADDYSYRPGTTTYQPNDHLTLYRNGVLVWGQEPAAVATQTAVEVRSENRNSYAFGNTLSTYLNVRNTGNQPLSYADLTVRYWFSPEGTAPLRSWVDWAQLGASNLTGRFGQQNGQTYFETSFAPGLGELPALSRTGDIRYRLAKTDWSAFDETNDYSYRPPFVYAPNDHVTAYYRGQLIWGQEPATGSARQAAAATAATLDVRVLGNPVTGEAAELEIRGVTGQALELQLLDMHGHPLLSRQVPAAAEVQRQQLPMGKMQPGVYLLKVITANQTQVVRLLRP